MENSTDPSQTCPAARSFVLPPSGLLVFCAQPPCAPNMDSFAFSCAPANCEKREAKKNRNSRVIKMLVVKWPLRTLLFPANKQQSNWAYVTLKRSIRGQSGGLPMQRRGRYPRGSPRWVWILDWGILLGHELISLKEQCAQVLCRFTLHTNNEPRLLDKCLTWYLGELSEFPYTWRAIHSSVTLLIDWLTGLDLYLAEVCGWELSICLAFLEWRRALIPGFLTEHFATDNPWTVTGVMNFTQGQTSGCAVSAPWW